MLKSGVKALGLGVLLAVVGFSYAVATNDVGGGAPGVAARGIGSFAESLRFTNAVYDSGTSPVTYDLGDVVEGQGTVVRYLTAAGGIPPYTFTEDDGNSPTLTAAGLTLSGNGLLTGQLGTGLVSGAFTFLATVTDSAAGSTAGTHTANGNFRLGLVPAGEFRFAVDKVASGLLGLDYSANIATVGGTSPVTVSVVSGSVKVGTVSYDSLADIGLSLASDGTLSGRPLYTGTVTFTAHAVDANSTVAKGRYPAVTDNQVITLVISDTDYIASGLTTSSLTVKIDTAKTNYDSVKYRGTADLNGISQSSLKDKTYYFRIGTKTISGPLDSKGKYRTRTDTDRISSYIKTKKGRVSIRLSKADLSDAFGSLTGLANGGTVKLVVQLVVENAVAASEALECEVKVRDTKYTFSYKLGKKGTPLAGAFQLVQTKGSDKTTEASAAGDRWKLKFYAVPRSTTMVGSLAGLDNVETVTVLIGGGSSGFEGFFDANNVGGDTKLSKSSTKTQFSTRAKTGLKKVKIDARRYLSQIYTNAIAATETLVPQAETSTTTNPKFVLALEVTRTGSRPTFTGVTGKVLEKKGSKGWADAY